MFGTFGNISIVSVQTQSKWSSRTIWGFDSAFEFIPLCRKVHKIYILYTYRKYTRTLKFIFSASIECLHQVFMRIEKQWQWNRPMNICIKAPPPFEKSIHKTINNSWRGLTPTGKISSFVFLHTVDPSLWQFDLF